MYYYNIQIYKRVLRYLYVYILMPQPINGERFPTSKVSCQSVKGNPVSLRCFLSSRGNFVTFRLFNLFNQQVSKCQIFCLFSIFHHRTLVVLAGISPLTVSLLFFTNWVGW